MTLPKLSLDWDIRKLIGTLFEWARQIEATDAQTLKKNQNIEMGSSVVILTGDDGLRYKIEVVAGSITATAL